MASFIFGGDTNETPESIKRKRDIARALLQASAPRNVGEGISALGDGIVSAVMNSRADKAEKTGMASADSAWASILGGSTSQPTAGATGGAMPTVAGSDVPVASLDMNGNDIFTSFMDTVKGSGVTNPNALAAVAATGKHESGFSPGNINRRWSDPSESGQAGTSGGAMSWRAERLANLENFARSNGEDPRNISPATQAKFFLQEDPQLVARLNTAKTPEEAQQMMNEAWKFAGWNRPGGEAAARIATAKAFLPSFMEQGDTGAEAIETIAPLNGGEAATGGQSVTSENFDDRFGETLLPHQIAQGRSGVANALQQPSQQMQQPQQAQAQIPAEFAGSQQLQSAMQNPRGSIVQALMEGQPADPAQIAQARAQGANVGQPQQGPLGIDPGILEALNNPFLSDGRKAVLKTMVEQNLAQQEEQRQQQMKQADPAYQLDLETKRAQLEKLRNPEKEAPKVQTLKLSDGSEMAVQWNSQTQNWDPIQAPSGGGDITPKTKLTEAQSKLTLFQNLQTESQPVLLDLESQFNPANMQDAAARSTPIAGNFFKTEKGQMYEAAATSWAEGALRIATGAAATPEEMERTKRAYFAQPGDTPTTIAFKAQMREMYNRSIEKALGSTNVEGSLPKPSEFVKQFEGTTEKGARTSTGAGEVPEGVDPADWEFMTPEERALFQ